MLRNLRPLVFSILLCATSAAAQQPPAPRVVDLTAPDGLKLKATFFAAASPGPGMLLLHQCNRQRNVWDDLAARMASAGLNVMTLDLRGYGDSEGTRVDKLTPEEANVVFNEKIPRDIEVAYQFLIQQPGVSRASMAAGGASCGVNQSVHLAMNHSEIKALLFLSEITNSAGRSFLRAHPGMPLFLATAEDDPDFGVSDLMQWIATFSTNPRTKFIRYKTGGHGVELFPAHPELPPKIVDWLTAALKSPGAASAKASPYTSPVTTFFEALDQPNPNVSEIYATYHSKNPQEIALLEVILNRLGYDHLQNKDNAGAIAVLKLNASIFPNSPNVYDSLGDAYLADGQKDLARQNAQKALELLANDTKDPEDRRKNIRASAEQKLKQLSTTPN